MILKLYISVVGAVYAEVKKENKNKKKEDKKGANAEQSKFSYFHFSEINHVEKCKAYFKQFFNNCSPFQFCKTSAV